MLNDSFKGQSPITILFILFLSCLVGFLVFLFIGVFTSAIALNSWDLSLLLSTDYSTPEGLSALRIMQIFQTFGLFIFPSIVVTYFVSNNRKQFLGFEKISIRPLILSALLMIISIPGINFFASLNALIPMPHWMIDYEKTAEEIIRKLLSTSDPKIITINFFMIAILPAIAEELFFRGLLQRLLCKFTRSVFSGVLITSIIFSAIHLEFQGFIPRMLLGMVFGYIYIWTGSIWAPMLMHFINNGLAVLAFYLISSETISPQIETVGDISVYWQIGVVSIVGALALIKILHSEKVKLQDIDEATFQHL